MLSSHGTRVHDQGPDERRLRILVVDDERDILVLVRLIVEGWGHECRTARSAEEAHALLERESFDCMLVDVTMPDVDGATFLRQVRAKKLQPPHVALISALPGEELGRLSHRLGVPYIPKPFTNAALRRSFDRHFGIRV